MKEEKGGATVILDVKDYIAKANKKIKHNSFYQKLNVDPTAKHSDVPNSTIESFRKQELLSNSTTSKFILDEVRTPQFHILPKIHKPNIPGIPAISSIKCHIIQVKCRNLLVLFFSLIANYCLYTKKILETSSTESIKKRYK